MIGSGGKRGKEGEEDATWQEEELSFPVSKHADAFAETDTRCYGSCNSDDKIIEQQRSYQTPLSR